MNAPFLNDLAAREELTSVWSQALDPIQMLVVALPVFLGLILLAGWFRSKLLCKA